MQKILIVEDDLAIQALLHDFIQEAGYSVELASDGVEALSRFSEQNFDLVLLDIMLPKIDGYGVCEVIRQKSNVPIIAAVLCLSLLTGCNAKDSSTPPDSQQTNPPAQATVASANISDTSEAYEKLVALKTEDYKQQSVADFNQSLAPNNGDISGLLDAQADVLASISPDDKNYEFITVTLAASLDELYCEQMNDSVGLSAYLKKEEQPLEKLPGEESVAGAEITYQFVFNALYRLNYTFSDPTQITVAERDSALQKFKTEFQNYVDNLSEADLASSNIKTVLSEKADELENSLSTAKMKLSCEVENVEVHNAGEEIVNN